MRYLTKSRFKLALECPTKLHYVGKPEYLDNSAENSFLATLAEGGYQVGELACLMHPEGVRIHALDSATALAQTAELLKQSEVTIFEAAMAFENFLVRVDILIKRGDRIELIEVKAKSYDPVEVGDFRGAKGQLLKGYLSYLQDVAFQRWVVSQAMPGCRVSAFLMLADKSRRASVDGMNQRLPLVHEEGRTRVRLQPGTSMTTLGEPMLTKVSVDAQVDEILGGDLEAPRGRALPFAQAVRAWATAYAKDERLDPVPSSACASCQYRADHLPQPGEPRSGFHECWADALGWKQEDFSALTVLDLWRFLRKDELMAQGVIKLSQLTADDLKYDAEPPGLEGLTPKHRQWYLCKPDWPASPGGRDFYIDVEGMRAAMSAWRYPLHCIDFETSTVALPFLKGRRPYETTAFQFSHHVMHRDGRVQHQTQWLLAEPGVDPNIPFVRALREALQADDGTVMRWATHENTVLNHIREQLLAMAEPPADRDALLAFIEGLTERKIDSKTRLRGPRAMVDLCKLAERYYFHPSTKGSNSLKKVLPALMRSSALLRERYGQPSYGPEQSLNLTKAVAWWQSVDGEVLDPYTLLPPVFDDIPQHELDALAVDADEELREGGAAMAAYARLQFEDLAPAKRKSIEQALLRYCELDTLAMVMAIQAWQAWVEQ